MAPGGGECDPQLHPPRHLAGRRHLGDQPSRPSRTGKHAPPPRPAEETKQRGLTPFLLLFSSLFSSAATTGDAARIADRPEVIEQRQRLGDFEGDTVLGPPGTGGVATLVDRQSRFSIVVKVQSKHADHVHEKIKQRLQELDEERRRSITFDNGTEFARCHRLEKHLGLKLYFADPGCPYQRGTNENTNGLIRQYFPKGTDFRDVSHSQVREAENKLNNRPRAGLGFRTPSEVFFEKTPPPGCI